MNIIKSALTVLAILVIAASLSAQSKVQDKKTISRSEMSNYVVSAKAGVVNIVEGEASVVRARPFAVPEMLISGDELQAGDEVKTGPNGRAEILLNPGCYLRVGNASQIVFLFDGDTSNTLKLLSGAAVIEASVIDAYMFVETPKTKIEIARTGIYRFNSGADSKPEVIVRKGQALIGKATIKDGRQAMVNGGSPVIAKLNKSELDTLDDWSRTRAKSLIAANNSLSNRGMRRTVGVASVNNNAWIYDPFCRCYTFLPITGGFSSPYGWDYSVYNPYWYRSAWPGYYGGGSSGNGSGGSRGSGSGSGGSSGSGGGSGAGTSGGGHHHFDPPRLPSPVFANPDRGTGGGARGADRETAAPHSRRP